MMRVAPFAADNKTTTVAIELDGGYSAGLLAKASPSEPAITGHQL